MIISSLILFTLLGCGISVPFLWDSSKVSLTRMGQSHTITVKDPEYTPSNGYHVSVMYAYCLTDLKDSYSSSWWSSFEKNAQRDSHNSKTFRFREDNINPKREKDTTEYPIFMLSSVETDSYDNGAEKYLFNEYNVKFQPNHPVKIEYSWDDKGYLDMTASGEDFETFTYKLARSNGQSFWNHNFKQEDPEFQREKDPMQHQDGNDYLIHVMPIIYAYSDHHPNQKFHISTGSSVVMDTRDIHYSDGLDKEPPENEKDTI